MFSQHGCDLEAFLVRVHDSPRGPCCPKQGPKRVCRCGSFGFEQSQQTGVCRGARRLYRTQGIVWTWPMMSVSKLTIDRLGMQT